MTKHRLRESIKSFFGIHVDAERDEELKESKAEIEEKVQKILEHLKDDSEKDMKESLSTLIEDFHKHYQSLYARYNHLTGELRKKVHGKQEKESSSSSSDSDSDYSPTKKGSKNGKLRDNFEKEKDELKQELENASLEVSDLKMKLAVAQEEKDAFNLEFQGAVDKLHVAENDIIHLKTESERHNAEKFELLAENEDLKKKLQNAAEIEAELNQKLVDAINEKHKLVSEKEAAMVQLEERNKVTEDLRTCSSQLKDEIEELNRKLQAAAEIEAEVDQKLADAINEKTNLISEKEATVVQLEERSKVAEDLKSHSIQLKDEIEELNKKLQSAAEIEAELNQKLADATNEKHILISEKEAALSQVEVGNKVAEDLRFCSSQLKDEIEESNKKLQSAAEIEAELNQKLADAANEKHNLISEKEATNAQVEEGNKVAEDLRSYSSQLKDEIEELNKKLQSAAEIEAELNQKLEGAINEKHNLISEKEAAVAQVEEGNKVAEDLRSYSSQLMDEIEELNKKLQSATEIEAELNQKLTDAANEKHNLISEKEAAMAQVEEGNKVAEDLRSFSSQLKDKIDELNKELHSYAEIEADLNQKLECTSNERNKLILEKEAAVVQIEEGNKIAEDLRSYNSQLKDEKAAVVLELEATIQKLTFLNEELESSEKEIAELRKKQTVSVEENSALSSKILLISEEIKQSQSKMQELITESSQLKVQLDEKEKELLTHTEMHESHKNEVSSHIRGLELELDSLHNHRKELEKQKGEEVSELLKTLENKEKDSLSQIEDLMAQNKNLQLQIDSLLIQKSDLEKQLSQNSNKASAQAKDLTEQLNGKQQKLESLVSHKVKLMGQLEEKTQEIADFLIRMEGLKEELASTSAQHQRVLEDKESFILQLKNLEQEVSSLQNTKSELEEQLRNKSEDIAHLHKEKESIQSKFLEMESIVVERDNEICVLKKTSEDREVESSAKATTLTTELNDLQERLNSLEAQISESDSLLEQKAREIIENTNKIGSLQEELTSKNAYGQRLLEEKEGLALQLKDLELEIESLRNGKSELEGQFSTLVNASNQLKEETERLQGRISELEKVLLERENEFVAGQKKLEDANSDASTQIVSLTELLNDLRRQKDFLESEKIQLELQMERGKLESSVSLAQVENQNSELANQLAELEKKLRDQEDAFSKLHDEHIQLELRFQECQKSLEATDTKMKEMTEEYQKNSDARNQKVDELEEVIEDLKGDLEMKVDEICTLVENVRNIEVKLRLTNQKLRITEQLLTEKEDNHKSKEEKLQEGQRVLEERITVLSELVADYKEAQHRIISDVPDSVNVIMTEFDTFNMKFEEDCSHLESRIYEILNEHKVIINWIKESNCVKEQLKEEIDSLMQQLKNERYHSDVLKEKVGELEKIIQKKEYEKDHLLKSVESLEGKIRELGKLVKERDEMMGQLELQMKGKDEGILELGEEKREAIRQLCVWIEYHRDRYDTLKEMVSKTTTARRHIAA